jgi:hypothetical protein
MSDATLFNMCLKSNVLLSHYYLSEGPIRNVLKIPGVFRIRKSKDRQHNDQTKKENKNDLQNIMRNTKGLATRKSITDEHM